jgi:DNA-binding CsgD family transcriptional regulator
VTLVSRAPKSCGGNKNWEINVRAKARNGRKLQDPTILVTAQRASEPISDAMRAGSQPLEVSATSSSVYASAFGFLSPDEWNEMRRTLRFSVRESEIASLIVMNLGNATIAAQLGISAHTVHSYLERLYRKLGIGSREELISRIFFEYVCRHTSQLDKSS